MKNKNYLKVTVMLFAIALFFVGCSGGNQKDNETSKVKEKEKVEESSKTNVTKGKIDDAMIVEIYAQLTYITAKFEKELANKPEEAVKISEEMSKTMEDIYKKLGVTEDEIEAYSEKNE